VLLPYTDGIVEAADAQDTMFGVERLRDLLEERIWTAARELVERVFAEVGSFSGLSTPRDDQAVVAVVRQGRPGQSGPSDGSRSATFLSRMRSASHLPRITANSDPELRA